MTEQAHAFMQHMQFAHEIAMPTPLSCITHPTHAGHGLLGERVAQQAGKVIARELCNGKLRTTRLGSIPEAEMHSIMLVRTTPQS